MVRKNKAEKIFLDSPLLSYKKGKVFFKPGDKIDKIYYLASGNIKQYVLTPSDEELVIHIFKKGSFFPIALILGKTQNRFYFEALTNVKVRTANYKNVLKSLNKDSIVLFDLTKRLAKGIDGLTLRLEETLSGNVQKRLVYLLYYLARSFGSKTKNGVKIRLPLTHQNLASWLGVSRETVSRQMKLLEKRRVVNYKYKQIILKKAS